MGKFDELAPGSIVFSRWQPMVVIHAGDEEVMLCPLVSGAEPKHRADMELAWHELAEAGLARADVRFRGVVCRRRRYGLQVLGHVAPETVSRMTVVACREEKRRLDERGCASGRANSYGTKVMNGGLRSSNGAWMSRDGGRARGREAARWSAGWRSGEDYAWAEGMRNNG